MINFSFKMVLLLVLLCSNGLRAQMTGIGAITPTEMLDVNGRMRIQHSGQTAGIYFNNSTLANRSFAGMMNADYMGFWGVNTNWNLVMNTNIGNVGIGTTSPTARLDVNGTLRIRQNAKAGAVMTGLSTQGNMGWVGPVYFLAMGTPTGADLTVHTTFLNYTRFALAAPDINHGNAWNATNYVFVAPLNGIYHFAAHMELKDSKQNLKIQLIRRRGNVNTVLYYAENFITAEGELLLVYRPYEMALDTKLEMNDVVWLEVTNNLAEYKCTLVGSRPQYYFSGQLVALQ